jgi:bifunctional non-homologous end joining protein LigD
VLEEFETSQPPFDSTPRLPGARFVEPLLVAEVEFAEWTADGVLRHPVFVGLRADKDVRDVVLETGGPKGVA